MPLAPPVNKFGWPQSLAAVLIVIGLATIAASFVLPAASSRRAAWSDEQAKQYQAASIKLHSLSHEAVHAEESHDDESEAIQGELKKAQAEFDALRGDLESAMGRPKRLAWLLRVGGVLLVLGASAAIYRLPAPEPDEDF
jgi:hypothetical protein